MTALSIQPPFPTIPDIDGQPLEDGYIWIGVANLAPITNPITVYWDAALTLPAAQPVRTLGGYPMNSGTPGRLYVNSNYSILVQNKTGSTVYSSATATERYGNIISAADVSFLQAGANAVERSVQSKLRDVVSVKDFGAVGDGVTDDAAAIQLAVNAATANQTVYFPAGTYAVGAAGIAVTNKTGVTLLGDGAIIKITAISSLTTNLGAATIRLSGCTRSGVRGLEINGNSIASSGVGLTGCTECFVDNVTVYSSGFNGQITSVGGVRNEFTNNTAHSGIGVARGLWLGNCFVVDVETDIYVAGNIVRNNPASGIVVTSVGGRVIGNHSRQNIPGSGIVLPGANGVSAKNLTVANNYCIGNGFHGIQSDVVYTSDADLTDAITVTGNVCNGHVAAAGSGIYAVDSQRWAIVGNSCMDNVDGIICDNRVRNVTISGNTCGDTRSGGSRTQQRGIRCNAAAVSNFGVTITGNTCNNNTDAGIALSTVAPFTLANVSITGNTCRSNGIRGIFVAEATLGEMTKFVVTGNTCNSNGTHDIRLSLRDVAIGANAYTTQLDLREWDLTQNSATPDVPGRTVWRANNTIVTAITAFNGGIEGQQIVIRSTNGNTTVNHGGLIVNPGAANITIPTDGYISYQLQNTVWRMVFKSF